jgi:hypothetical protein
LLRIDAPLNDARTMRAKADRDDHAKRDRRKMMEHLEAALALADKTADGVAGYMIERALDELRASMWSGNLDVPPRAVPSRRVAGVRYRG